MDDIRSRILNDIEEIIGAGDAGEYDALGARVGTPGGRVDYPDRGHTTREDQGMGEPERQALDASDACARVIVDDEEDFHEESNTIKQGEMER